MSDETNKETEEARENLIKSKVGEIAPLLDGMCYDDIREVFREIEYQYKNSPIHLDSNQKISNRYGQFVGVIKEESLDDSQS